MKLTNLTGEDQQIILKDYFSRKECTTLLVPYGVTEIVGASIQNAAELVGKIQIDEEKIATIQYEEVVKPTITVKEEIVTPQETVVETHPVSEQFICDICGAEFASARGLASHKNRVHAD